MSSGRDHVWSALLSERDRALRVAAARCGTREEAEDVVQEAFARIAAMPDVDVGRVGPLLSSVIGNLAVDGHRSRSRAVRAQHRLLHPAPPVPEEVVCDRAEAQWLWTQRTELSPQDRRMLELRTAGLTLPESAEHLGITYRAAENALGRARRRLRAAWRATAALLGVLWTRRSGKAAGVAAAVPAALAAALALVVVPHASARLGQVPPAAEGLHAVHATLTRDAASAGPAPKARASARPRAPGALAAAPAASPASRVVARTPAVRAGRVEVGPVPVTQRYPDESLVESVRRCVENGVSVDPTRLGCRPS